MDPLERERRIDELLARDEIAQVILRLAGATDRRDEEAIRACYHADAFDDHGAFQGGPAEFAAWVREVLAMFAATQHFLAPPRITLDGEVAHAETYCTAHHVTPEGAPDGARDAVMGLRYLDRFERRGGVWRIARRTCVWDYTYIVPAGDQWPLGPSFRLGRPGRDDPSYALHVR